MNRRTLVLALASMAGIMISDLSRSAQPCLPLFERVDGGISVSTACAAGASYTTNFEGTENPLSERGRWVDGKVVGLDWNNPLTVPGIARASINSGLGANRYDDSIAHLSTSFITFGANQYAQGTVYRAAGYPPGGSKHEVELLLRFQITAHNARGYEVLYGIDGGICVVRWNGPLGSYTELACDKGATRPAVDGDVLRAEIIDGVIKVYKNGVLRVTAPADTTWATGQPGMGFWPVDGATKENYGWKAFTAGSL